MGVLSAIFVYSVCYIGLCGTCGHGVYKWECEALTPSWVGRCQSICTVLCQSAILPWTRTVTDGLRSKERQVVGVKRGEMVDWLDCMREKKWEHRSLSELESVLSRLAIQKVLEVHLSPPTNDGVTRPRGHVQFFIFKLQTVYFCLLSHLNNTVKL